MIDWGGQLWVARYGELPYNENSRLYITGMGTLGLGLC